MRYVIPHEIKSETRVAKNIYLFDFFFLIVYGGITALFANAVTASFLVMYWIFSILMGLLLISGSKANKKRRFYQSIIIYLKKDRYVYRPIPNISKKRKEDEK